MFMEFSVNYFLRLDWDVLVLENEYHKNLIESDIISKYC